VASRVISLPEIRSRTEMEEWRTVSIGSPVRQNEIAWLSHGHKVNQRETRTGVYEALKRGGFAGLVKGLGKCKGVLRREPTYKGERSSECVAGMQRGGRGRRDGGRKPGHQGGGW
jgi:hypothetical protein